MTADKITVDMTLGKRTVVKKTVDKMTDCRKND